MGASVLSLDVHLDHLCLTGQSVPFAGFCLSQLALALGSGGVQFAHAVLNLSVTNLKFVLCLFCHYALNLKG